MEWYHFRKRYLPAISPIIYYFAKYDRKTIGSDHYQAYLIDNGFEHQLINKQDYDNTGAYLLNRLLKDKDFVKKSLKQSRKIKKDFLSFCKKDLIPKNLGSRSDSQLIALLYRYFDFFNKFSLANVPNWVFLPDALGAYLMQELDKFAEDPEGILATLSTPTDLVYSRREEIDLITFVIKIKQKKIKDFRKDPGFNSLVKKYYWIPFDQIGPKVWTAQDFKEKIDSLLKKDLVALKKTKQDILDYQQQLKAKQKSIVKTLKLSRKTASLFQALRDTSILQDEKKETNTESQIYLQNIFKELAKRTGNSYSDFYFVFNDEVKDILAHKKDIKKIAAQRYDLSITVIENGKFTPLVGDKAKEYARKNDVPLSTDKTEEINEVKGTIGSKGYAKGKARLIRNDSAVKEFKQGEILITAMTTPDFVPMMKKAAAIVTDEGGITCHAAIVSRELKIPCIIGTFNATKVFKDGDLIEVDADKGIVRKVKK